VCDEAALIEAIARELAVPHETFRDAARAAYAVMVEHLGLER
jgi:hypothetical protein